MIATETSSALEFKQVVIASDFGDEANRALAYAKVSCGLRKENCCSFT
jgi:hypothetical protein